MRLKDLFCFQRKTISINHNPEIIISNRGPNNLDIPSVLWWYDRTEKIMYRATSEGYIKD